MESAIYFIFRVTEPVLCVSFPCVFVPFVHKDLIGVIHIRWGTRLSNTVLGSREMAKNILDKSVYADALSRMVDFQEVQVF